MNSLDRKIKLKATNINYKLRKKLFSSSSISCFDRIFSWNYLTTLNCSKTTKKTSHAKNSKSEFVKFQNCKTFTSKNKSRDNIWQTSLPNSVCLAVKWFIRLLKHQTCKLRSIFMQSRGVCEM